MHRNNSSKWVGDGQQEGRRHEFVKLQIGSAI